MLSSSLRLKRTGERLAKRALHDLQTLPGATQPRPIISTGPPGYSAVTGHVATVFGSTGFLGRYLVAKLAKMGTQVIVAYRDEDERRRLKLMGDLGKVVSLEFDLRNEKQIAECVRHSDIVFNLVGRNYETKNFSFSAVHAHGAERLARISAECGVPRFVHISHLNADLHSPSSFYQSKAEGESLVKEAFDGPTIIRPAVMFGYEDRFLTNMAMYPIWWKLNHGETKVRPVHVMDVAQSLANLVSMPKIPETLSLPGPSTLTHEYLLDLVSTLTYRPPSSAPVVPKSMAMALARVSEFVWWPMLSPDEVTRRYIDDVDTPGDWDTFGIAPAEIEEHAISYVRRFRSWANFGRPVVFPGRPQTVNN